MLTVIENASKKLTVGATDYFGKQMELFNFIDASSFREICNSASLLVDAPILKNIEDIFVAHLLVITRNTGIITKFLADFDRVHFKQVCFSAYSCVYYFEWRTLLLTTCFMYSDYVYESQVSYYHFALYYLSVMTKSARLLTLTVVCLVLPTLASHNITSSS